MKAVPEFGYLPKAQGLLSEEWSSTVSEQTLKIVCLVISFGK